MSPASYRRAALLLFLAASVVIGAGLGLRSPWPADEPRFALIARDMADFGDWLFPRVAGDLYPDKPPLFFWTVAGLYEAIGSISVAVLLPGLLAGLGILWFVVDLGRRLWGQRAGIACGITLLAMLQFPLQMKAGQIDALLCLWTTLGLYGLCRHLLLGPDWGWYAVAGAAAGLGVITKGVGVLPYLIFIPFVFAVARNWPLPRFSAKDARWLLAPAATLGAIALWLVPMLLATTQSGDPSFAAYRDNILFHQTITRYADSWGHIKPPWYLLTHAVPWLWLPVTALLPWLVPRWIDDLGRRSTDMLLLAAWVVLVIAFFSLSDGKRSVYVLPALPAAALLAGRHIGEVVRQPGARTVLLALSIGLGAAFLVLGGYAILEPDVVAAWVADEGTRPLLAAFLPALGIAILIPGAAFRRRRAAQGLLVALGLAWLGHSLVVAPSIDAVRSGRALVSTLESRVPDAATLAFVDWPEQFLLHWPRPAVHFGYRRDNGEEIADALRWLSDDQEGLVLLPSHLVEPCFDLAQAEFVATAHRRDWYLVDASALSGECDASVAAGRVVGYVSPRVAGSAP